MREGLRRGQRAKPREAGCWVSLDRLHDSVIWNWAFRNVREPAAPPLGQPMSSAGLRARGRGRRGCAEKRGHLGRSWEPWVCHPYSHPCPAIALGATRSLRTSQRPRGAAAPRFARLGLLLVANVETGSQKLFNNRNGLHQSQRRLHYNPTNHRPDGLRVSGPRVRQRDTVTHHNSLNLVQGTS